MAVPVAKLVLVGRLTKAELQAELSSLLANLSDSAALLVDATRMTGYDQEARDEFVAWNAEHRHRLRAVAVVSEKMAWRVVVSAMAFASRQKMKAFHNEASALSWLETLEQ